MTKQTNSVPPLDLSPEIASIWEELMPAVERVLRSGYFILGPEVEAFEREAAEYLGAKHAVALNSGTDALVIALRAFGIGPGDEVICPSFTFFATAESISIVGATPVFVDIRPDDLNIDPAKIEQAITKQTKAIMPVHLFGCPVDIAAIQAIATAHDLKIIEDTAQAFGASINGKKVGSLGDAGTFSFFPTKNLGACGDGGLLVLADEKAADEARKLRNHGSIKRYANEILGYNSRLDALQATILRIKLKHIDGWNERRREIAARYTAAIQEIEGLTPPPPGESEDRIQVFHQYTLRVKDGRRDKVQAALKNQGVSSTVYYPTPCHQLPVYQDRRISLPETEAAAREVLSLPIWALLDEATQQQVISALRSIKL